MDVNGQVALVTGGTSGLGRATVERLLTDGARVVVVDLPTDRAESVVAELGSRASFVAADVRDEAQVSAAVEAAGALGDLRVVVNCAGIANAIRTVGKLGPFPLTDFARVIEVNLIGTFNVIRLAAERMASVPLLGEERGVIINTASVAAYEGQIGQAAYSASKAGVVGMTLPIARDLSSMHIRVVTIAPGTFETPMLMETLSEEARSSLGKQVPHPSRLGKPAEYAHLASHIISNAMINGETIRLDGAIRMAPR